MEDLEAFVNKSEKTNEELRIILDKMKRLGDKLDSFIQLIIRLNSFKFQFTFMNAQKIIDKAINSISFWSLEDAIMVDNKLGSIFDNVVINDSNELFLYEPSCYHMYSERIVNILQSNKFKLIFDNNKVTEFLIINRVRYFENNGYDKLFEQFIIYGYKPDLLLLNTLLKSDRQSTILMLLDVTSLPLTHEQFDIFLNTRGWYDQSRMQKDADFIDILITKGLKVDHDMVVKAAQQKLYLNDIGRFNVDKEKLKLVCADSLKYAEFLGLDSNLIKLRELCSRPRMIERIIKMIEAGTKPDIICLENATKGDDKPHRVLINYLVHNCHIVANEKCVRNFAENDPCCNMLLNSYLGSTK